MSPLVEAAILPMLFLSVVLGGALRPGAEFTFAPPTPAALVAAMLLFALFVRSGTLLPGRLLRESRSALANLNGLTVVLTAFAASAQVITLLVPDGGVPALIGWTVLLALLAQALVMGPDRPRVLRGLLVTFGVAFVLKFIVLAAISSPADGRLARALQLFFDGVTLGTISQRPPHAAEPYLAFATIVLFLVGVAWLPSASWMMVRQAPAAALPGPDTVNRELLE